jgi:BMFP domain-containing protein YqiC
MSAMRDPKRLVDEVAAAVAAGMPQGLGRDLGENLRGALAGVFDRLDLVTREELEVQEAVLRRTREKVQVLEKQVAELEARLDAK